MLRQQAGIPCQDDLSRLPGHWLLARMGKKVLHPGGRKLTEKMIGALRIGFNILNNRLRVNGYWLCVLFSTNTRHIWKRSPSLRSRKLELERIQCAES